MKPAKLHFHFGRERRSCYGRELETGDVLQKNDLYSSTHGTWERCPCPGIPIRVGPWTEVVWVRPESSPDFQSSNCQIGVAAPGFGTLHSTDKVQESQTAWDDPEYRKKYSGLT